MSYDLIYGEYQDGQNQKIFSVTEEGPSFRSERSGGELSDTLTWFETRLEKNVDEQRLLPDSSAVLATALRLGLSEIEESDLDAEELIYRKWLEAGKEERVRESVIEDLKFVIDRESLESSLSDFESSELFRLYQSFK